MKTQSILASFLVAAMVLLLFASCDPIDPGTRDGDYPEALDKLLPGASCVLRGKVLVLHTSLTDEEDVERSGVVEVTEVVDAPVGQQGLAGQQITVQFANIKDVKEGEERLFFVEPYWFGEFLGVAETGSVNATDKLYTDKELAKHVQAARKHLAEEELRVELKASPLVIAGKVLQVNATKGNMEVASEHNPEWMEAEIQVDETLGGKADGGSVKVLFAGSKDVMYYRSPKLKQGDDGIFVLEKADEQLQKLSGINLKLTAPKAFVRGRENLKQYQSLMK